MMAWVSEHLVQLLLGGGVGGALMYVWRWRQERASTLRVELDAQLAQDTAPLELSSRVIESALQATAAVQEINETVKAVRREADEAAARVDEIEKRLRDERTTHNEEMDVLTEELREERKAVRTLKRTLADVQPALDRCKRQRAALLHRLGIKDFDELEGTG